MAWITTVKPEEATGELKKIYDQIATARAGVAEVHRAQSLNPRAIRAHMELYKAVMFARSSLTRTVRERIGVVVSASNRCRYCVRHHGEAARQLGDDATVVAALERGEIPDTVAAPERALLQWAQRGTVEPTNLAQEDVERLRAAGLEDGAILDAALVIGYFNFVNRLVLLLGVEIEADFGRYCSDIPPAPGP